MYPTVTLNNGVVMPQLGLGVWQIEDGDEVRGIVEQALAAGYRAIDTAAAYNNERGVGEAIRSSGVPRKELFITTKLWNTSQGYGSTLRAFEESLERLGLKYLDLYLIHWPMPKRGKFIDTWRALEKLYQDGVVRAIGVSNFKEQHLGELLSQTKIVPAVNQIEVHPYFNQQLLRDYSRMRGVHVESWSPLMRGGEVLKDKVVQDIAHRHHKTPAQVIIRWHLQHGLIVIPKTATPERIRENIDIFDFELSRQDMRVIDGLNRDQRVGPDPDKFNS